MISNLIANFSVAFLVQTPSNLLPPFLDLFDNVIPFGINPGRKKLDIKRFKQKDHFNQPSLNI